MTSKLPMKTKAAAERSLADTTCTENGQFLKIPLSPVFLVSSFVPSQLVLWVLGSFIIHGNVTNTTAQKESTVCMTGLVILCGETPEPSTTDD